MIAALVAAVVALGGGGSAGYYLHGSPEAPPPAPLERIIALEQWRATKTALDERDKTDHAGWVSAVHEMNVAIYGLRDAVVTLTERLGAMDARLKTLESGGVRTAGGHR